MRCALARHRWPQSICRAAHSTWIATLTDANGEDWRVPIGQRERQQSDDEHWHEPYCVMPARVGSANARADQEQDAERHAVAGDLFLCGLSAEHALLPEGYSPIFYVGWLRLATSSTAAANSCGASCGRLCPTCGITCLCNPLTNK